MMTLKYLFVMLITLLFMGFVPAAQAGDDSGFRFDEDFFEECDDDDDSRFFPFGFPFVRFDEDFFEECEEDDDEFDFDRFDRDRFDRFDRDRFDRFDRDRFDRFDRFDRD